MQGVQTSLVEGVTQELRSCVMTSLGFDPYIRKAKSPFWETYVSSGNNITQALSAPWCGRPPWYWDSVAGQIKQMWYVGNVTMTAISVAVGIRNLSHY